MFPLIQLPRKSEVFVLPTGESIQLRVSINSTSEEVRSICNQQRGTHSKKVSINSTSEEVRSILPGTFETEEWTVSINSTSEEVRRILEQNKHYFLEFPLIQLPRKSEEAMDHLLEALTEGMPEVSINSTSEEVRSNYSAIHPRGSTLLFPLIQLPRKSEVPIWGKFFVLLLCGFH